MSCESGERQRVQVVVRGRRFEFTVAIASTYTSLFRRFFHEAFGALRRGECGASAWLSCYHTAAREQERQEANRPSTEANYTHSTSLNGTRDTNAQGDTGVDLIVPVAAVDREEHDGNVLWRFVYTSTSLLPEDVGVIFVYIRKLFQWSRNCAISPQPQLPVRWDELPYDAQLSLARVVCTFGVEPLIGHYDRPTAAVEKDVHEARGNVGSENTTGCVLSTCEKAEEYLHRQQQQQEEEEKQNLSCEAGQVVISNPVTTTEEVGGVVHPSVEDDDLFLETMACSRCGITGHTDAACVR